MSNQSRNLGIENFIALIHHTKKNSFSFINKPKKKFNFQQTFHSQKKSNQKMKNIKNKLKLLKVSGFGAKKTDDKNYQQIE